MIRISFIIWLVISSFVCFAQYKDAGMWTDATFVSAINKKLDLAFSPEIRLNENITRISRIFADLGLQYKLNKHVQASLTSRTGFAQLTDVYQARQRFQFGVGYKIKLHDFSFAITTRWQLATRANTPENDPDLITTIRNKIAVKYSGMKKMDFSTSFELFNKSNLYNSFALQNWRWVASAERKLNKRNFLSIGYLIQKSMLVSPQEIDFVVLVSYQHNLNWKKKKGEKEENPEPSE